jgi:amino acid permease
LVESKKNKNSSSKIYSQRIEEYKKELIKRQRKVDKLKDRQLITIVVMCCVFIFSTILFFSNFFSKSGDIFSHFISVFYSPIGTFLFILFFLSLSINITLEKDLKKAKDKNDKLKTEIIRDTKIKLQDKSSREEVENFVKEMKNEHKINLYFDA